jgi:hypothetical protein
LSRLCHSFVTANSAYLSALIISQTAPISVLQNAAVVAIEVRNADLSAEVFWTLDKIRFRPGHHRYMPLGVALETTIDGTEPSSRSGALQQQQGRRQGNESAERTEGRQADGDLAGVLPPANSPDKHDY